MAQAISVRELQERGFRFDVSLHGVDDVRTDEHGRLVMNYHITMRDPSGAEVIRRSGPDIWPTVWQCIEDFYAGRNGNARNATGDGRPGDAVAGDDDRAPEGRPG